MSEEKLRLSKLMSQNGICSRREADEYIKNGLVKVNGEIVNQLGIKVSPHARVELVGKAQRKQVQKATVILNKPIGYVSSQPEDGYEAAVTLITSENQIPGDSRRFKSSDLIHLAPAGRLDIDSQGLLILTQDGVIAKRIIGERANVEKEYLVRVKGQLSGKELSLLRHGLSLDGKPLQRAQVEWINKDQLRFVLTEGKKRQIRRMCELVGLRVTGLKRVRIGQLVLGQLPEGKWRFLKPTEKI